MTPADPPSGRSLADERLARIRASQDGVVQPDETVLFLLAQVGGQGVDHADCSNLSHAEAARIFEEAWQMRDERDAVREALAASREAFHALVCNAEGYDKSIVRTMVIWMRAQANEQYRRLGERVLKAEEQARRFSRCQDVHPILAAARPDEPTTTEGGA